jgi:hypothetical protein
VEIKKYADCRQKEKKKGGDEEGRSSLMPKPNEILQLIRERPFNLKGGRGVMFFSSKKIF